MLMMPNLDNQTFEDIVLEAVKKLPYICPSWTDYNSHDPGITLIELFAWYKQLQQYHMNVITDSTREMFLKLLGEKLHAPQSAQVIAEIFSDTELRRGTLLITDSNIPYELESGFERGLSVKHVVVKNDSKEFEITEILQDGRMSLPVFSAGSRLFIGMSGEFIRNLTIYWSVYDGYEVHRNEFCENSVPPRHIRYTLNTSKGELCIAPTLDETYALSKSGFMKFELPDTFAPTKLIKEYSPLYWIGMELTDAGCEEYPQVRNITAEAKRLIQRINFSETNEFILKDDVNVLQINSRLAMEGSVEVFVRDDKGWRLIDNDSYTFEVHEDGLTLLLNLPSYSSQDGMPNVRVVCIQTTLRGKIWFKTSGLTGEKIRLSENIEEIPGKPYGMLLCCGEMGEDGILRYVDWRRVTSLRTCGPYDKCYTMEKGNICFGDNISGAIPEKGNCFIANFGLCQWDRGTVQSGTEFIRINGKLVARAIDVTPGREQETVSQAMWRLPQSISSGGRAVTCADYEALALKTPGRRVAAAKAIPLYDVSDGNDSVCEGVITIVVVPFGNGKWMPDERFLADVRRQMEKHRTICTDVKVVPPTYAGINVFAHVVSNSSLNDIRERIAKRLESLFRVKAPIDSSKIGQPVRESAVIAAINEEVDGVREVLLSCQNISCRKNKHGDLLIPRHSITYLASLDVKV